jgi:hypothetical protein
MTPVHNRASPFLDWRHECRLYYALLLCAKT